MNGSDVNRPVGVGVITTKPLNPPADGRADSLWKIVRILREDPRCRVVVLSLCPQPQAVTEVVSTVTVDWSLSIPGLLSGLLKGLPIQVSLYRNPQKTAQLAEKVGKLGLSVIIADMARTSLVALGLPADRRILDMDDRLSYRYAGQARHAGRGVGFGNTPWWFPQVLVRVAARFDRRILAFEASRLSRFEERICKSFDDVVLVSEAEARVLEATTGRRIMVIPNYIDLPQGGPQSTGNRAPSTLLYFGNMSTAHNVDTALFLANDVFPLVRATIPQTRLQIVGRNMAPEVGKLDGVDGISIHPDVPDITEFLSTATACICPMRFGSGIKTKILEALYLGLPVITTPVGAKGIPDADKCMVVREGKEALADAAVSILLGRLDTQPMLNAASSMLSSHYAQRSVAKKWRDLVLGS